MALQADLTHGAQNFTGAYIRIVQCSLLKNVSNQDIDISCQVWKDVATRNTAGERHLFDLAKRFEDIDVSSWSDDPFTELYNLLKVDSDLSNVSDV